MREQIVVPFHKKNVAINLGADFDTADRNWYITEKTPISNFDALHHLTNETNEQEDNNNNIITEVNEVSDKRNIGVDWKKLIELRDSLKIAAALRESDLPEEAELRTEILKILSVRTKGNYPFTYDGMINLSENFAKEYPTERVQLLANRLTSAGNYISKIQNSDLSSEERALMFFVLPFGAE